MHLLAQLRKTHEKKSKKKEVSQRLPLIHSIFGP
jgi:hypothetical protein